MTILTGGPEHLYVDQVPPPGARDTGFADGLAGNAPHAPELYDRTERAAYFQGHIRGTLAARENQRTEAARHFIPAA